jgi:hypothetical protein
MTKIHEDKITFEVTAQEDPETGDMFLPLPPELLEKMGWKEGDILDWKPSSDGTWIITKKDN